MKFTLTADAPVKVPDVDAICLKKIKRVAIPEEEQNKIKDTFGKGQPMQEEKNENEQAGTYTVDGQVCWACHDLYNIVLKSKYPVIIEQLFCIRVVETSAINIWY